MVTKKNGVRIPLHNVTEQLKEQTSSNDCMDSIHKVFLRTELNFTKVDDRTLLMETGDVVVYRERERERERERAYP